MQQYAFDVFVSYSSADQEFARQLVTWLRQIGIRVWIDEEQLVPGARFRAGLEQGLRECQHMIAILTLNYYSRAWTQREIDLFDLSADHSERRLLAVEIEKGDNNQLDQAFLVHQRIRWETKIFDPVGFWKLYCGLKGYKPGDSTTWKQNGEKLLGQKRKRQPRTIKKVESGKSNIGEFSFSAKYPTFAKHHQLAAKCLDPKNHGWQSTFKLLQNALNDLSINEITENLIEMPWALGSPELAAVTSLALLPRFHFSYSIWPFIDLACNEIANWLLKTKSLKRSEPDEIWFSWAILEQNWTALPKAARKTGDYFLTHHFLKIARVAFWKHQSFTNFEKNYNYGIMITPWNHFHLSWLAARLGDNQSSYEHAKVLCSTTTSGDMRTGRFLNRFACWPIFNDIRSQSGMMDLIARARRSLRLADLKEIPDIQQRLVEIWDKAKAEQDYRV